MTIFRRAAKRDANEPAIVQALEAAVDITTTAYAIKGMAKPVPADLKSYEYDDLGLGWCVHVGYTYTQEIGELPDVWIHKLELNTGQHLIPLSLTDIPGADLKAIEAAIADEIDGSNQHDQDDLQDGVRFFRGVINSIWLSASIYALAWMTWRIFG